MNTTQERVCTRTFPEISRLFDSSCPFLLNLVFSRKVKQAHIILSRVAASCSHAPFWIYSEATFTAMVWRFTGWFLLSRHDQALPSTRSKHFNNDCTKNCNSNVLGVHACRRNQNCKYKNMIFSMTVTL